MIGDSGSCAWLLVDDSRSWVLYSNDGCGAWLLVDYSGSRLLHSDGINLNLRGCHDDSGSLNPRSCHDDSGGLNPRSCHDDSGDLWTLSNNCHSACLWTLRNNCHGFGLWTLSNHCHSTGYYRYRSSGRSAWRALRSYDNSSGTGKRGGHGDGDDWRGRGANDGRNDHCLGGSCGLAGSGGRDVEARGLPFGTDAHAHRHVSG